MPQMGFEPTISAGERPQTYALDGAATGTGNITTVSPYIIYTATCFDISVSSSGSFTFVPEAVKITIP